MAPLSPRSRARPSSPRSGPAAARAQQTEGDPRWAAVLARDPRADGTFVYAVETTGVFCRPSCAARRARPENVSFHPDVVAAERAGFRPCRRCRPDEAPAGERDAARVADLCRFIEQSDSPPALAELARRAGWSSFHTQRRFKAVTGVTPRAYAHAQRRARLHQELGSEPSVTRAIYGAGYNSPARFYEKSEQLLGMTPSEFRRGGEHLVIRFALGESSLGSVLVAATDRGVCCVLIGDDRDELTRDLAARFPYAERIGDEPELKSMLARAIALVEMPAVTPALPLDIRGTAFQERVWRALSGIPAGETRTYSELAREIGAPGAARAVASACAANPLAVAIPCHRGVRTDGSLSGYRWGVERKRALLAREAEAQAMAKAQNARKRGL
jgi:AraC family transcriptional regulator of adaptative response/methylated-DNA-[protein]-cysteine methyltransferase